MELNIKYNQNKLLENLNNSRILIYGPGNNNIDNDIKNNFFDNYEYIFINSGMINMLKNKLDLNKFKIIHVLGGVYVDDFKDNILADDNIIYMYLVSEIHTMNVMLSYGIPGGKIMHMANNYKKFGISGWPQMGPKLFIFFEEYNLKFSHLMITGYTFYMNIESKESIYNLDYQDYNNLLKSYGYIFDHLKKIEDLTNDDKILLNKMNNEASLKTPKNSNTGHSIYEGYNLFLRFLSKNINTVKVDKQLKKIIKKYPRLLNENPF